jgi:hypothetical protein
MDEPLIAPGARKHGIAAEDMLHAVRNPIPADELDEGLTMPAGPARDATLLEVGLVDGENGPVIVHAMRARKQYLSRGGSS